MEKLYLNKHQSPKFQKLYNESKIEEWGFRVLKSLSKVEFKEKTGLKGRTLNLEFQRFLRLTEKSIMGEYPGRLCLNKQDYHFNYEP
jgi:hypothetical protein